VKNASTQIKIDEGRRKWDTKKKRERNSSTWPDAPLVSPSNLFNLSFAKLLSHLTSHVFFVLLHIHSSNCKCQSSKTNEQNEMEWKVEREIREECQGIKYETPDIN